MSSTASLIILTYNNLDTTRLCLDSIFEKTTYPDFELILVDNASQDQTPGYLADLADAHANVHIILNRENHGFAAGNNQGAAAAQGDLLVFLNNDVVVTPGWLETLAAHLEAPEVGMVGPVTNNSGNQSQIPVTYQSLADLDAFAASHTRAHLGQTFEIPMLAFHCVALRREVFAEIGPLDERFGQGMFEDDDYAMRLREKEYRLLCAEDVFVHHWGSASFSKLAMTHYWRLFKANLDKFEEKWGTRWQPHPHRQELLAEQLRGFLNGSIWLAEFLAEEQTKATAMEKELENIYRSDAWVQAQKFLASRDRLIPQGGRRDQLLQALLSLVRRQRIGETLNRFRRAITGTPGPARGAVVTETLATKAPTVLDTQHTPIQRRTRTLVSVILPVYNHADLLAEAAKSVLNSTYFHLELIILDDGSTDEVEPVLQRLMADPRVRVYRQPNQKLPRALTHAHQFARGDFITWTSADNLLAPTALEVLVETLLAHPEAVLAYADVAVIDEAGRFILDGSYRPQNVDPDHKEILRLHRSPLPLGYELDNYINACFLYRKTASQALEGLFADDLRGYEDYDFWLRLQKCGAFQHVANPEPLYFYRVHTRTMSTALLTQERRAHLDRGEKLIAYEAERRAFAERLWSLRFDESLPAAARAELQVIAEKIPVAADEREKVLHFRPPRDSSVTRVEVQVGTHAWELVWEGFEGDAERRLPIWKGISIHPLARKARELQVDEQEFPEAGNQPVVGCHLGLKSLPIDVEVTRRLMAKNAWATFIFLDIPGEEDPDVGEQLTAGIENALYLGSYAFGEPYRLYARCRTLWMPPLSDAEAEIAHPYRTHLALAYATGRPLLAPRGFPVIPAPYQYHYFPNERMDILSGLEKERIDHLILNRYLESWALPARLAKLIRYADPILQNRVGTRPDFEQETPSKTLPTPWPISAVGDPTPLKCGLVVNYLDKGGLERQVAHLARRLPDHGVETFVLCLHEGGTTAEQLEADGVKVYIARGQPAMAREIIKSEQPDVVNTQLTDRFFLELARELGIPVLETIHNTYVWFGKDNWLEEQARSRLYTHTIAVSKLVQEYYAKGNPVFNSAWMSTVPNGIDPAGLKSEERNLVRASLGIPEEAFLFLMLASYDGRKNQLATITAFDIMARTHPEAQFWFAGNVGDERYYERVFRRIGRHSKTRDRIQLLEFREDIDRLLAAADVFVLNSFFEGWSLAATEASMLGVPLIHSDCGSGRELVGSGQERGLLVPNPGSDPIDLTWQSVNLTMGQKEQRNTSALAAAMSKMITDRTHWAARREEIQKHAINSFSSDIAAKRYTTVFQAMKDGKRANIE